LVLDWRRFEFGAGPLFARDEFITSGEGTTDFRFSGHIRIGAREGVYLALAFMDNVPPLSGGGYFDVTVGFRPRSRLDASLGLSAGPYDNPGARLGARIAISREMSAVFRARLGASQGIGENAIALGLSYAFVRRAKVPAAPAAQ
jgi:hypothetical protein